MRLPEAACYTGTTCERESRAPCVVERITARLRADLLLRRTDVTTVTFATNPLGLDTPLRGYSTGGGVTKKQP
jgi:hypothetical protein